MKTYCADFDAQSMSSFPLKERSEFIVSVTNSQEHKGVVLGHEAFDAVYEEEKSSDQFKILNIPSSSELHRNQMASKINSPAVSARSSLNLVRVESSMD
jgi:hypothetical protein